MVERMVEMPGDDVPEDYKLFVYHGRFHFIQLDCDRLSGHKRNLYDRVVDADLIFQRWGKNP